MKDEFTKWMFEKRDIDGLIIAFMISNALNQFISDFTNGLINPIITAVLPTNKDNNQILNINDKFIFKFKLQLILTGLIKLFINMIIVYLIVTYIYKYLNIK